MLRHLISCVFIVVGGSGSVLNVSGGTYSTV